MYCLDSDNENMKLKATRDDEIKGREHIYWVIKAVECRAENKLEGDAPCSSQADIDDYLEGKVIQIFGLQRKSNYIREHDEAGNLLYFRETY